jgi:hypothetical protein
MDISHLTSQSLFSLISLAEKKEELLQVIAEIDAEIIKTLKGGVVSVVEISEIVIPPASKVVATTKAKTSAPKPVKVGRSGGLKDKILALLATAGPEGLRVKEIAEKLKTKATSISVWFSTTGRNITTKIEPGRFAAKGVTASQETVVAKPVPAAAPAKAATGRKPAKAKKKGISPEGRAKLAAAATARWAAVRAAKAAAKPVAAAKPTAPAKPAKAQKTTKA